MALWVTPKKEIPDHWIDAENLEWPGTVVYTIERNNKRYHQFLIFSKLEGAFLLKHWNTDYLEEHRK